MRIGISTGGGDCPGLNAVIRAAVKTAVGTLGHEAVGVEDGLEGLLRPNKLVQLSPARVRGLLPRGGTILGANNRANPFAYPVRGAEGVQEQDISDAVLGRLETLGIDAMMFIGGDGTQTIAQRLREKGLQVVGVPKTIDNDLMATDYTFGFDTAVNIAMEALDRLHTTAESHDRVLLLEVMGRDAGWIAMHAGLAGGADVILLPEIPWRFDAVLDKLERRRRAGTTFSIVVVAEGATELGGEAVVQEEALPGRVRRLGGAAERLADRLTDAGWEARAIVLGHIQRGGTPTAFDRVLATRLGHHAARMMDEGRYGRMAALRGTDIVDVDLTEAAGKVKVIGPDSSLLHAARDIDVSLGEG